MTDALLALDRLNRAARCWDCPVQPGLIYAHKDAALLRLWDEGLHGWRRVAYQVPTCGHCGGSGWHRTPNLERGERGDGCNRCHGFGSTKGHGTGPTLRFVESTIRLDDGRELVWHTPTDGGNVVGNELWNRLWPSEPGSTGTWKPRQDGDPMPAHEVARDLLTVEDWLGPVEWGYGHQFRIARDSVAYQEPAVVEWHRRHPAPVRVPYVAPVVGDEGVGDDIPF